MSQKFSDYLSRKRQQKEQNGIGWTDYDRLVQGWQENVKLPPPLSPKIPTVYNSTEDNSKEVNGTACQTPLIPQLLSPTLPPEYGDALESDIPKLEFDRSDKIQETNVRRGNHSIRTVKKGSQILEISVTLKVPSSHQYTQGPVPMTKPFNGHKAETIDTHTDHDNRLISQKNKYIKIAIDQKHKGDAIRIQDPKRGLVHFMDSINLYLCGFNCEDASRRLLKKLPHDRSWLSLIKLIEKTLDYSLNIDNVVSGLCLQILGVLYEHISLMNEDHIRSDYSLRKRFLEEKRDIVALDNRVASRVKNYIKYREQSRRAFRDADTYLSIFELMRRYPVIIREFEETNNNNNNNNNKTIISQTNNTNDDDDPLAASSEMPFHLPVTECVSVSKLIGYTVRVSKAWAEEQGLGHDWTY